MGRICDCPPSAALNSVTIHDCIEQMDQLAKIAGQRLKQADGTVNKFSAGTPITALASWTPLLAAADGSKIVMTPLIQEPENEAGAAREYGGGNLTLGGIPIPLGSEPSPWSGKFLQQKQDTIAQLKGWTCERMGHYLIDKSGNIGCLCDDPANPTEYYPIPAYGFRVGDKVFGGLEGVDYNPVNWTYLEDWSDKFIIVKPADFNAFADLANPVA